MKITIKGRNSGGEGCVLEVTDAGKMGLVWLNLDYFTNPEKSYIVVDITELRQALDLLQEKELV